MVGSGVFIIPAQLAPYGWTGLAAWAVAIPGALLIAYILSELAVARPAATGAVAIVGEGLGPLPGLIIGWSYWVAIWAVNAIIALTAIRYLAQFIPELTATPLATALGATALIWALTALNLGGARGAGRFQVVTTLLKLLPLIAVVLILIRLAVVSPGQFSANAHTPFTASSLSTALTLTFFPLVGFECASLAAERVRDPARNILRATLYGTAFTGLFYVAISNGIVFALPEATTAAADAPVALFVEAFWGRWAALTIAAFAAVATIGCLNGWVLLQGELPLGMARAGLLPRWFAQTTTRDVSARSVLLASGLASLLILSGAIPGMENVLNFMLRLTTASTVWLYFGACVAALRLGVARVAAAVGVLFCLWVLAGAGTEAALLSIALMLTAVPLYWLRPKHPAEKAPVA
jgi:basic amino acid/polyamine antiporter, APA family